MKKELRDIISLFREKLEMYLISKDESISTDFMAGTKDVFPKNSCKGASLILGVFLEEEYNVKGLVYVFGTDSSKQTHAWLELNDWVIDLTADQFSDKYPGVFIVEKNKSIFHSRFKQQQSFPINLSHDHSFYKIKNIIANSFKGITS